MAELHVVGQLVGASGFGKSAVFGKWGVIAGTSFELLEGTVQGQTQCTKPLEGELVPWGHPLDVHYSCRGITGWPKLQIQVWGQDMFGRVSILGYGFCHVPASPGMYKLECPTWIPEGSAYEEFSSKFIGGAPRLLNEELIHSSGDRFKLSTKSAGVCHLQIQVVMKDFAKYGIQC